LSHKRIIPSGLFSSAANTATGRIVVDQIDGDFSQQGKVVPSMLVSDAGSIFLKRDIQHPMQAVFNGIITNDKFCLSRLRYLPKRSARKGFPHERQYVSETIEIIDCSKVEASEKTTMEHPSFHD
jgi:hypothetical protein